MNRIHTCVDILRRIEANNSNPKALNKRVDQSWEAISSEELLLSVKFISLGLIDMGLQTGDHVGILAVSSPQWTMVDLAIMNVGGVTVALFASISDEHFIYEVKQTKLKFLFVEGIEQWEMYHHHHRLFNHVISIDESQPDSHVIKISDVIARGRRLYSEHPDLYQKRQNAVLPSTIGAIIYTSGSTGTPKGVELTHENITYQFNNDQYHWSAKNDRYLSLLPLEHVFGHGVSLWLICFGVSVYYTNDYKNLASICGEVKPTATAIVPRLLEKIHGRMFEKIQKTRGIKHWIAKKAFTIANKEKISWWQACLWPLLNKIVYSKLNQSLGGSLRVVISGGAALDTHLHTFFHRIGIPIYEGWGLTEACPVCVNIPSHNKIGTVGPALGHELKISSEGEVLVRGPLVMHGYYQDPINTAKTIDADGWLHTGDRGVIDDDGYLTILGRIKELYKTSTGQYVAPIPIEQALCRHPLIESAMVIAEGKKFTTTLLFPNIIELEHLKAKYQGSQLNNEEFLKSPYITSETHKHISEINRHLNHWEQIRAFRYILKPLSIKEGEMTPSMKLRRQLLSKKYSQLIDSMYPEEAS